MSVLSLRCIKVDSLSGDEKIEAVRLRGAGDFKHFGFDNLVVTVLIPGGMKEETVFENCFRKWEEAVKKEYGVKKDARLINVKIVDMNSASDVEKWWYTCVPLPAVILKFNTPKAQVVLATLGIASMVGLLELLAPLVDPFPIFRPVLSPEWGVGFEGP